MLKGTGWDVLAWTTSDGDAAWLAWVAVDTVTATLALEPPAVSFDPTCRIAHLHLRFSDDKRGIGSDGLDDVRSSIRVARGRP
jgi:hypothetical protein